MDIYFIKTKEVYYHVWIERDGLGLLATQNRSLDANEKNKAAFIQN